MARLSEEHFKSNASTPSRKSDRIRNMFRHRQRSSSVSPSSNVTANSTPADNPPLSPTIKLGFEKVGLLPSERSSLDTAKQDLENNGGVAVSKAIKMEVQELNGDIISHRPDTELDISATTAADEEACATEYEKYGKNEDSFEPAFKEELSKQRNEHAHSHFDMPHRSSSPTLDLGTAEAASKTDKHCEPVFIATQQTLPSSLKHSDDTLEPPGVEGGRRKSSATNNDSLSPKIHEYVSKKIAEALMEYHREQIAPQVNSSSAPIRITVNLDISGVAKWPRSSTGKSVPGRLCLFSGRKSIGPLTITDPNVASDFQLGVIAIYLTVVIGCALHGPKELLLTLWRMGIFLTMYAAALQCMGWKRDSRSDALLAPVCYMGHVMQRFGSETAQNLGAFVVSLLIETFRDMVKDVKLDQREE
ncbi:Nn.00g084320.m01.CDS01 [Neocucurbitaria sp. VM-36]